MRPLTRHLAALLGPALLVAALAGTATVEAQATARLTLSIEGMHCGGCADRLEDVVGRLEGVVSADVDFEQTRAVVSYDPRRVSPDRIVSAIEEAGFVARVES